MDIGAWLAGRYTEVTAREFYRAIWPEGELDKKGEFTKGKYVGIAVEVTEERKKDGKKKVYRHTITDDLDAVEELTHSNNFCICSPISYCGKERTAEHARYLYGIAIDLDNLRVEGDDPIGLRNLFDAQIKNEILPKPSYVVASGTGVHLYFIFDRPVALYREASKKMQMLKRSLTTKIWNKYIVNINDDSEVQLQSIYQGFRMINTVTKSGKRTRAFMVGDTVSLEYLKGFLPKEEQKKMLTLEEAKRLYPDWYERRVVNKEPPKVWHVSRNLYEWWKDKIFNSAKVGHRYYCMMCLAAIARKCSFYDEKHNPNPVTREELESDCFELMERFEGLTVSEDNHFDEGDVVDALEAFNDNMIRFPRRVIADLSGIDIPQTRRNYQKLEWHLEDMRTKKANMKRRGQPFKHPEGRPDKRMEVLSWFAEHPDGTVTECARDLGISRPTVYKHRPHN